MCKALSSWDEGLHILSVQNDYSQGLIWKCHVKEYKSIRQWSRRSSGQHELRQAKCPRNMKRTQVAQWAEAVADRVSFALHPCVLRAAPWTSSHGHLLLPDPDLPCCSGGSTTLHRHVFPDELLISADTSEKKSKQHLATRNGNERVINAFRVLYICLTSLFDHFFFIKTALRTYLSKGKALQISYGSFFRKPVSASDKINMEKCPICSDTGCIAGIEHRAERQCRQGEECSKAAEPRRGQGIWLNVWQHFLCKIGGKKISVFVCLCWKHNSRSSLVRPGGLQSCGVSARDSHFSPSQGLSTNTSAYERLPLAQRCITGFTVPAPKDTGGKLKQSLNSKPILSAALHSPGEEHPAKHPAAGLKAHLWVAKRLQLGME